MPSKLQAWWWTRQGLDGSLSGRPPAEVLEKTGWARSVGSSGPYLTMFSRAGTSREQADAAVAAVDIHELPSARGCTYAVPASHYAVALKAGRGFSDESSMNTARKLGVTDEEIDQLCLSIVDALGGGPLDPDALKELTAGHVRNLGSEGVKKGITTTLPVALGALQSAGEIRRIPVNGRLDQQRYRYARWQPNPLANSSLTPAQVYSELARLFFSWIGPATLAEFQWFSGLGVKAAKAAVEPLSLERVEESRLLLAEDRGAFDSFAVPNEPRYALIAGIDGLSLLRRDVRGLLAPQDWERPVWVEKGYQAGASLTDLPNHAIVDRGRVIGLWDYDTATNSIAWMSFIPRNSELEAAVRRTEDFVRDELGDARTFSLDSPKSRAPRIDALRRAAVR